MILPQGVTEAAFLAAIEKVVNLLASSFKFGSYEIEDIKQEARLLAIKAMPKYDTSRPLENFLYTHVKNRLINFRRDHFWRNDPPCLQCHNSICGRTTHADGKYCERYTQWYKRIINKHNIVHPLDLDNISDEKESSTSVKNTDIDKIDKSEVLRMIDIKLPVALRATYLQMLAGEFVPKSKRTEIENVLREIIRDNIECVTEN